MNKHLLRTSLFYVVLAVVFFLLDLAIDHLSGSSSVFNLPHLIISVAVIFTASALVNRAVEIRRHTEAILRQGQEELETRLHERTITLERTIATLHEEIAERQLVEQTLGRSREETQRFSSFPQVNPNPVLEIDASGTITYCNSATTEILRKLGQADDGRAFLPDDLPLILHELEQKTVTQFYREVQVGSAIFGETIHLIPEFNAARIYAYDITELIHAGKDLRNALAESRQRQAEVSALLTGSRAVIEQHTFEGTARAIFIACKTLLGATAGYIALANRDRTQSQPVYLDPGDAACLVEPSLPMPIRGMRDQVYQTGQAIYENDFARSQWTWLLPEGHVPLDNVLFAPLKIKEDVIGLFGLANKAGGFNENDLRMVSAFAELATISLVNIRTSELLEISEERFRSVVQTSNDAIITIDTLGNIVFWNSAAEKIFGYRADEIIGQPFTIIMPQSTRQAHEERIRRDISDGQSAMIGKTIEGKGRKNDGSEVQMEVSLSSWHSREGLFFTCTIRDITERKRSEETLARMQARLVQSIQERTAFEERQRLARELHDSVSQALYGISLGVNTAITLFDTDQTKVREALTYVLSQAQAGLTEMRALIFELRPESLEVEGLVTALSKQTAALQARHGIQVELSLCDEPEVMLSVKEALYRISQEALQNAIKHARSNRLDVRLVHEPDSLSLEICDNGVGFDPQAAFPGHLGLHSMRERAKRVGGTLEINSGPGCGTQILARIPIAVTQTA